MVLVLGEGKPRKLGVGRAERGPVWLNTEQTAEGPECTYANTSLFLFPDSVVCLEIKYYEPSSFVCSFYLRFFYLGVYFLMNYMTF